MKQQPITIIQPRHSYASETGDGHIHLSAPALSAMARIEIATVLSGQERNFTYLDENLQAIDYSQLEGIVGFNLVGAPYIPVVVEKIKQVPQDVSIVLGGQIVSSLTEQEFDTIFRRGTVRENIFNGNKDQILETLLQLPEHSIPEKEEVDMTVAYAHIPDEQMKEYLSREFSIYVSQGCKYDCKTCQACKAKKEEYRNLPLLKRELLFLGQKGESFGIESLSFYMSNLDILQSPNKFNEFLDVMEEVEKETSIKWSFRGLAGLTSFEKIDKKILERARKLGLSAVGYGIDGATIKVRRSVGKHQNYTKNSEQDLDKATRTIRETFELGITPEVLMVFGHVEDTAESLEAAFNFCKDMNKQCGAMPHPYVLKDPIPGSEKWYYPENKELVDTFVNHPEYFQALDYAALASEFTHPDEHLRRLTNEWYIKICNLTPEATQYIIPNTPEYQQKIQREGTTIKALNEGKFDR